MRSCGGEGGVAALFLYTPERWALYPYNYLVVDIAILYVVDVVVVLNAKCGALTSAASYM